MNALEAAKVAEAALEDKLGEDIKVLDQKLFQQGVKLHHSEGYSGGTWILLDFGNLLVHLFNREEREFYGLDHVWGDAKAL